VRLGLEGGRLRFGHLLGIIDYRAGDQHHLLLLAGPVEPRGVVVEKMLLFIEARKRAHPLGVRLELEIVNVVGVEDDRGSHLVGGFVLECDALIIRTLSKGCSRGLFPPQP
jgi:hypothetical protein